MIPSLLLLLQSGTHQGSNGLAKLPLVLMIWSDLARLWTIGLKLLVDQLRLYGDLFRDPHLL